MFDKETGLYNAKARYFDPQLGRFLTQDSYLGSIDDPPSLHRYFYGHANPLRFVDPTGHDAIDYFKDAGKSLYGFGKGVAKGTANLVVGAVVGTGKLAITSAKYTLGTPEIKIQAAHELGEMGNALIDGVKDQARLLKQGLSNPSQILDAAAEIGPEAYGEVIGGATVDTALTATMFTGVGASAKVAQGAEAVVVGESRVAAATAGAAEQAATRARVLANIDTSQSARQASRFGEFAESGSVVAAEANAARNAGVRATLDSSGYVREAVGEAGGFARYAATEQGGAFAGGRVFESQQRAAWSAPKSTRLMTPSAAEMDSAAFKVIVGERRFTRGGAPRSTILDATSPHYLEFKGGSSILDSTYQLRLQTYMALRDNQKYTITTTRPVAKEFSDWLIRWGGKVQRPGGGPARIVGGGGTP